MKTLDWPSECVDVSTRAPGTEGSSPLCLPLRISVSLCRVVFLRASSSLWLDPAFTVSALISRTRLPLIWPVVCQESRSKLTAYLNAALRPSSARQMGMKLFSSSRFWETLLFSSSSFSGFTARSEEIELLLQDKTDFISGRELFFLFLWVAIINYFVQFKAWVCLDFCSLLPTKDLVRL